MCLENLLKHSIFVATNCYLGIGEGEWSTEVTLGLVHRGDTWLVQLFWLAFSQVELSRGTSWLVERSKEALLG